MRPWGDVMRAWGAGGQSYATLGHHLSFVLVVCAGVWAV